MTTGQLLAIVRAVTASPMIEIRECLIAAGQHDAAIEALNNLCDQLFPWDMQRAAEEMAEDEEETR